MLLPFSKRLRLYIRSSSTWIKFQLLLLIQVVGAVRVFTSTASSAASNSSYSESASSSSGSFYLSLFLGRLRYFLIKNLLILLFVFVVLVVFILSFLQRLFRLSCLVDFMNFRHLFFDSAELEITRFSLVTLRYQPPLDSIRRIYVLYLLAISTTYHYSGHNHHYLTFNPLASILPTKQTKKQATLISIRPVLSQTLKNTKIYPDIRTYTTQNISHIIFLRSSFQFFLHLYALSNSIFNCCPVHEKLKFQL